MDGALHCRRASVPEGPIDIAVLASGSGTNLQAMIDNPAVRPHISLVLSDRSGALALDRAGAAGIPSQVVAWSDHADRDSFSVAVADNVEASGAKGVILAGFMRVLAPSFLDRFPDRVLNIHPSLLPAFPGAHAVEQALAHGVKVTGVTVHFVDEQVDHGPIVLQEAVAVQPGDDWDSLEARVHEVEHRLFPAAVRALAEGRIRTDGRVVRVFEEAPA